MRKTVWALMIAALLLLPLAFIIRAGPLPHTTAHADDEACPPNPSPPDPADPSIIVDTPVSGQQITSPVLISGQARVFEAVVSITIAQGGKPIVETTTMAAEGQVLSPFSVQVPFMLAGDVTEGSGCIRVFESSAKDGSPINVVQIPVTFATGTKPPSTGDGGLAGQEESSESLPPIAVAAAAGAVLLLGLSVQRRHSARRRE
jgi:immunoglobulin-like protein involved in spore germination